MDSKENDRREWIGYEYKEVITDCDRASFLIAGYESFGWKQDEKLLKGSENEYMQYSGRVVLRLKRNSKIVNKMELTRLQRKFEACVKEIEELEKAKTSAATMYALILGILGALFMTGAVLAAIGQHPQMVLCILLAIPGALGCVFPIFIYKKLAGKHTEKLTPFIEEKYDEIYETCEKGNRLLRQ